MKSLAHLPIRCTGDSRQRVLASASKAGTALLALSLFLPGSFAQAQTRAARQDAARTTEPLSGRRVLVLLPLRTSQNWTANRIFTQAILPNTQRMLERALTNTGRYSVVATNRFNAVLQRGVNDNAYTQDDLTSLLTQPTVDNARPVVSKLQFSLPPKLRFADPPLIAEFIMERLAVNTAGATTVEIIGRFYDPLMVEPVMSFTVVGAPQTAAAEQDADQTSTATALATTSATTAFVRIANESIKPVPQLEAPLMANPTALTPVGAAGTETPAEGDAAGGAAAGDAAATPTP
ncbi:MAG TPA: hypothetical protein VF600_08065 [Abditibacteriaceae bacterium]|jgi:hypothetical protein